MALRASLQKEIRKRLLNLSLQNLLLRQKLVLKEEASGAASNSGAASKVDQGKALEKPLTSESTRDAKVGTKGEAPVGDRAVPPTVEYPVGDRAVPPTVEYPVAAKGDSGVAGEVRDRAVAPDSKVVPKGYSSVGA